VKTEVAKATAPKPPAAPAAPAERGRERDVHIVINNYNDRGYEVKPHSEPAKKEEPKPVPVKPPPTQPPPKRDESPHWYEEVRVIRGRGKRDEPTKPPSKPEPPKSEVKSLNQSHYLDIY
jgi:hypothetical protein